MGDIARITDSSERTGVMSIIMSVRQFGLIFGENSLKLKIIVLLDFKLVVL